jgi:hypothetical protein
VIRQRVAPRDFGPYRSDPVGYCRDVLAVQLSPAQEAIARSMVEPPYRTLAPAGHNVGKSFVAACLVSWWFDTRKPGVCLTTAPTARQVVDILWKEVRRLRGRAGLGGFAGPKAPRLETNHAHFAHGFTARDGASFQGQHEASVFVLFDEAEGVAPHYWEAAQTMLGPTDPFLAIYNPIRQDSQAYVEEQSPGYKVVPLSAVDHPNITAELAGQAPPYPQAIRLGRLRELLQRWAVPLLPGEQPRPSDVRLGDLWYRPGPIAESRLLGRRPSQAVNAVWPEYAWQRAETTILPLVGPLQIGCDVARFGDDFTAWHVRRGGTSLHHESVNGWPVPLVAERCKQLATEHGKLHNVEPRQVLIATDDSGVGGGVTDILAQDGWAVVGVNSAAHSPDPDYPNLRSALWFGLAEEAALGNVSFLRLLEAIRLQLRRELTCVTYTLDLRGRRCVEPKDHTKQRLKRSPDNADACLLAYANVARQQERVAGQIRVPT